MNSRRILVLGASGYVGSRLVPWLLEKGWRVRAVGRSMKRLQKRFWSNDPNVELAQTDVFDSGQLRASCKGCRLAYYLVHSMNPHHKDFSKADRQAAQNMMDAAEATGLERIIYLSGLGNIRGPLSEHLRSRSEVGKIFYFGKVPPTILRAAMIIGTGSASFEMFRYLVNRLPIIVTPRWVDTESQPIAIRDVLAYLVNCLENKETIGQIFDIGGPDVISYRSLIELYADEAHLPKRWIVSLPFFPTRLISWWIDWMTPVPAAINHPLLEGIRNRVVCENHRIDQFISPHLLNCRDAIRLTLSGDRTERKVFDNKTVVQYPELRYPGDPPWVWGSPQGSS